MNGSKDLLERRLEKEYVEALDAMRFTDAQKARMAANIAAEAGRSFARSRASKTNDPRRRATMKPNSRGTVFRNPAAVAAAAAVCLILPLTALAASGGLKGFFIDTTDWRGAIVGQTYEQATDEIDVDTAVENDQLIVTATFADPQMPPYNAAERLGIGAYQIVDAGGKVVKEGSAESAEIVNGQAAVDIHLDGVDHGNYTLAVTAFVAEKKADQPLNIAGNWECAFTW